MFPNPKITPEKFTIGIEEEFQIIDPVTRELRSHIQQILENGKVILKEQVKAEMHQSVIEIGTEICKTVDEARKELVRLREIIAKQAKLHGLKIAASGTHPFSHWVDQDITNHPRYKQVEEEMQQVARANLIFGLHVHVAVEDRDTALHIMNAARYFLPHVLALSTNSPFWIGRNTGFHSYRLKVFDRFPRTGIPDYFVSISEYDNYIDLLIKTNCIDNAKKVWWDVRLHPFFNTLEFRICDIPMRIDESLTFAALFQALVAKLYRLVKQNMGFRLYRRALIMENRWRACRYGLHGKLIDFGRKEEMNVSDLISEILEFVDDVVDDLGSREQLKYINEIFKNGTGSDRQLAVYNKNNDLREVVDYIVKETYIGLDV